MAPSAPTTTDFERRLEALAAELELTHERITKLAAQRRRARERIAAGLTSPSERYLATRYLVETFGLSIKRACELLRFPRTTYYDYRRRQI